MTYRTRNIVIAVVLAVLAALLTSIYVSNYKRNVRDAESSVTVWTASRDIPAGTAGADLLAQHLLTKQDVAKRTVVPGAISSPDQLSNQLLTQPLYAGEQVTARRFGSPSEIGIRSQLKGTLRAIQIPGAPEQLLAGTLRAGDHVDLVVDIPLRDRVHVSRVVLRDLLVLRAAQTSTTAKVTSGPNGGASVMLAVRDSQAPKLQWVIAQGRDNEWSLQLRPPVKSADSPEKIESVTTILKDGVKPGEFNRYLNGGR